LPHWESSWLICSKNCCSLTDNLLSPEFPKLYGPCVDVVGGDVEY